MARKNPADAAKEKAAKQKKVAIVLGVVLALALGYAVHTMMGLNGSPSSAPQAADTTSTTTTPTPATGVTPSLPSAPNLSGVVPVTTTPAASSQLISAVQAPAGAGQLQSFSLFDSKDPFHSGGPGATTGGSSGSGGGSSGTPGGSAPKTPKVPPAPPTPPPTSAVISVNGSSESVNTGSNFPAANPLFQLVSLTETTAQVSIVGGSYASGSATLTLRVNKPVTLVNTADGTRYTLTLMPQGTTPTSTGSTSAPATTTPTTTTTSGG